MAVEGEPIPPINYMDTLVPVEFVLPNGAVERLRLPPNDARNPDLISALSDLYKRYSFDEVVVHIGYSRAEGGMPDMPEDWPIYPEEA